MEKVVARDIPDMVVEEVADMGDMQQIMAKVVAVVALAG